jgi:kumamolisin
VALHASVEVPYWMYYLQDWKRYGGTSFAAPVFAGLMASVNSYRLEQGRPVAGYLNPILYQDKTVQSTFRDIQSGRTDLFSAHVGWDYPTGWGAPRAFDLAHTLP